MAPVDAAGLPVLSHEALLGAPVVAGGQARARARWRPSRITDRVVWGLAPWSGPLEADPRRGKKILFSVSWRLLVGQVLANCVGAFIAFVYLTQLATGRVRDRNVLTTVMFAIYLPAAVLVGAGVGVLVFRPVRRWLSAGRSPTPKERRRTLRQTRWTVLTSAVLWAVATLLFSLLTIPVGLGASLTVAVTVGLAGTSVCTFSALVYDRLLRPVVALALATSPPKKADALGVRTRIMLVWLLASGVPLLGLGISFLHLNGASTPSAGAGLFLVLVGLGAGALGMSFVARSIADPVVDVRYALAKVGRGSTDVSVVVYDASEVGLLQSGVNTMVAGLRERQKLQDLFGRQVGVDVARRALEQGVELGGEARDVAVLFVDLVGSTTLATRLEPHEVVRLLNRFFGAVVEVTHACGGFVNKFEGDAALCVFGAPDELADPAGAALGAARELHRRLTSAAERVGDIGIGVDFGTVVAGNVGNRDRYEYTVIGDPVNSAARLTDLAKADPGRLLVSGAAVAAAGRAEAARWVVGEEVTLRGRSAATVVARPAA